MSGDVVVGHRLEIDGNIRDYAAEVREDKSIAVTLRCTRCRGQAVVLVATRAPVAARTFLKTYLRESKRRAYPEGTIVYCARCCEEVYRATEGEVPELRGRARIAGRSEDRGVEGNARGPETGHHPAAGEVGAGGGPAPGNDINPAREQYTADRAAEKENP